MFLSRLSLSFKPGADRAKVDLLHGTRLGSQRCREAEAMIGKEKANPV